MYHEEGSAGAFQLKQLLQLIPLLLRWAEVTCRIPLGWVLLWKTAQGLSASCEPCQAASTGKKAVQLWRGEEAVVPEGLRPDHA